LKAGDDCPASCGSRLYDLKEPTALMQFTGQPLITAIKYEREALRCAKCQQRYIAPLPEGVKDERYDATCDATIALMRYGGVCVYDRDAALLHQIAHVAITHLVSDIPPHGLNDKKMIEVAAFEERGLLTR
jgi:hypothetical protein